MNPLLTCLLICAFVLTCFAPMFARHSRRRSRLRTLRIDDAELEELEAFNAWKGRMKANADYSDAAALCFALAWFTAPAIPPVGILPMIAALVLPFIAVRARHHAIQAKRGLPMLPKGHKWLDARRAPSFGVEAASAPVRRDAGHSATDIPEITGTPKTRWRSKFSENTSNLIKTVAIWTVGFVCIKALVNPVEHRLAPDIGTYEDDSGRPGQATGFHYTRSSWWGLRKVTYDQIRFIHDRGPQYFDDESRNWLDVPADAWSESRGYEVSIGWE